MQAVRCSCSPVDEDKATRPLAQEVLHTAKVNLCRFCLYSQADGCTARARSLLLGLWLCLLVIIMHNICHVQVNRLGGSLLVLRARAG
jgi:hypothetical protein